MNLIHRYLMIVFASVALLFGIQVPNFLDQYEKRVDAHLKEVEANIEPYQIIADKYHKGVLSALFNAYSTNKNPTFRETGVAIKSMYQRQQRFLDAKLTIDNNYFLKAWHVIKNGDHELIQETLKQYSYSVPLNQDALVSGVILAVSVTLLAELLFGLLGLTFRSLSKSRKRELMQSNEPQIATRRLL